MKHPFILELFGDGLPLPPVAGTLCYVVFEKNLTGFDKEVKVSGYPFGGTAVVRVRVAVSVFCISEVGGGGNE